VPDEVSPSQARFSAIDVIIFVLNDKLHLSLSFNRQMKFADKLQRWAATYLTKLSTPAVVTSSSSYASSTNTEQVAECTNMQDFFVRQHPANSLYYTTVTLYEVHMDGSDVRASADQPVAAWQKVVDKHPMLRTTLAPDSSQSRQFAYLRKEAPVQRLLMGASEAEAWRLNIEATQALPLKIYMSTSASIIEMTCERCYFVFHSLDGLIDASSIKLIEHDLKKAYDGLSIEHDTRGFLDAAAASKAASSAVSSVDLTSFFSSSSNLDISYMTPTSDDEDMQPARPLVSPHTTLLYTDFITHHHLNSTIYRRT
jgi:hypothetical protein